MKERDKYNLNKYVLLILVKIEYREFSGLQNTERRKQ